MLSNPRIRPTQTKHFKFASGALRERTIWLIPIKDLVMLNTVGEFAGDQKKPFKGARNHYAFSVFLWENSFGITAVSLKTSRFKFQNLAVF